jgi:transposase
MPAQRVSMRKVIDVLRLRGTTTLNTRQIAKSTGVGDTTVREYLRRAKTAGLSWPLPEDLDESELEGRLYPPPLPASIARPLPDFEAIHHELRRKGVTLTLLWEEHIAANPDGYRYSQFCELYKRWRADLDVVMRQVHRPGERLFVDYAGQTMNIIDNATGEVHTAQIFVATLGASNYTYVEATMSQRTADFVASHVRCFTFLSGVPEIVVPDNLKTGITKAHRYEPGINRTYTEVAEHYGFAIIPTRAVRPRDKAKVEVAVQIVERWILARLRDRTFFSLGELNAAIRPLAEELNDRPLQKLARSRSALFEELDRPALRPLPEHPYELAEWKKAKVNLDYHIEVAGHYYSVPHTFARKHVDIRATATAVECFAGMTRVASHMRDDRRGRHTTVDEHMPPQHRSYARDTPKEITRWAARIGESMTRLLTVIVESRAHPEQGYRTCLGILRMSKVYGEERREAAAHYALTIGARSYGSIESILKHGKDQRAGDSSDNTLDEPLVEHDNIRGPQYYRQSMEDNDMQTQQTETDQC